MRDSFISFITKQAIEDSSVMLLTADLGFGSFDLLERSVTGSFLTPKIVSALLIAEHLIANLKLSLFLFLS